MQLMLRINTVSLGFEEREYIMNFMSVSPGPGCMPHYFRPGALRMTFQQDY
jgi:NADH:ubiquinone oxidoreductase subunit D